MSPYQPLWLRSSLEESHLSHCIRILESREAQREIARACDPPGPLSTHSRVPFLRPSLRPSDASKLRAYYACAAGQHPSNRRANRYIGIEPYDRTRVLVPNGGPGAIISGDALSDASGEARYLNANWVREVAGGKWWIAGQAPLPNTVHAFLTLGMCLNAPPLTAATSTTPPTPPQRVHTIVQLTLPVEGGRRRAHPYFGRALRDDMVVAPEAGCTAPPIHVHVEKEETIDDARCVRTDLRLRWGSVGGGGRGDAESWSVTHLLYTAWPDFGVPEDNGSILNFARLVQRVNDRHLVRPSDDPNASPPMIIHCSAGVGRTGSFIALSSILRAYSLLSTSTAPLSPPLLAPPLPVSPLGPFPDSVGDDLVVNEVDGLREQRGSMLQRGEQIVWVYEALSDAFEGM